jgi:hypothetical protein
MNNLQQRIVVVLLRWLWDPGQILHGWDIQGQLRRHPRSFGGAA